MDNGPVLWCKDLRKRFKDRLAVDGVGWLVFGADWGDPPGSPCSSWPPGGSARPWSAKLGHHER